MLLTLHFKCCLMLLFCISYYHAPIYFSLFALFVSQYRYDALNKSIYGNGVHLTVHPSASSPKLTTNASLLFICFHYFHNKNDNKNSNICIFQYSDHQFSRLNNLNIHFQAKHGAFVIQINLFHKPILPLSVSAAFF